MALHALVDSFVPQSEKSVGLKGLKQQHLLLWIFMAAKQFQPD